MFGIYTPQSLLRFVLNEIPLTLTVILIVATINLWLDEGGDKLARKILMRRRMGWFLLAWLLLLAVFVITGYLLSSSISWWYLFWSTVGSSICIILLRWVVSFTAININAATEEEFASLPDVNPELVQQIIEYREQSGGFRKIEDLKKVPGINDSLYKQVRYRITI